jgi:ATP adenylyltransferase
MGYIRGEKKPVDGCVFCIKAAASPDDDATHQVIARSQFVYAALNLYPYNSGHMMIIPYAHVASQESLPVEALTDLMVTANRMLTVLRRAYNPPAFNLGANLGRDAGAGIAEHFHFHIVPRWPGDASFMSVVGNTRVIPDTLENTYAELKAIWHDLYEDKEHGK